MVSVLVAGLATVDFLFQVEEMPRRAEKYKARDAAIVGGGGAANAAVSIARLGGAASLLTQVGDDRIGDMILDDLAAEGVSTSLIAPCQGGQSAFSSVLIDANGERQIVNFRGSGIDALPKLEDAPRFDAVLADTRFPALTKAALGHAKACGIPGVVDGESPIDITTLEDATHVAFSAQGLMDLAETDDLPNALISVAEKIAAWVCVTDGANGTHYIHDGSVRTIPAVPIEAIDTLAAGDVWHGAFALQLAEGASEEIAMNFANAAASLKCKSPGGRDGAPDRDATNRFMRDHGRVLS